MTCDFVVSQLRRSSVDYFRLNSEDLAESIIQLDPIRRRLQVESAGAQYVISPDCLRSVYFRRPVFLRDYGDNGQPPEELFSRQQWTTFICNLMLFDEARWINDPAATYRAELKGVQLSTAARIGFAVPETIVTNAPHPNLLADESSRVAIKGLDTVLLRDGGDEMFGFTTFDRAKTLVQAEWRSAPAIIQAALTRKLDIRVTVVEERVFAASIEANGMPIADDWRRMKSGAEFRRHKLPPKIVQRCVELIRVLGLRFGGIDLAYQDGEYFFLEVNPTGEWAWLVDSAGLPIDAAIAEALTREDSTHVG